MQGPWAGPLFSQCFWFILTRKLHFDWEAWQPCAQHISFYNELWPLWMLPGIVLRIHHGWSSGMLPKCFPKCFHGCCRRSITFTCRKLCLVILTLKNTMYFKDSWQRNGFRCGVVTLMHTKQQFLQWYMWLMGSLHQNHKFLQWFMRVKTSLFYHCFLRGQRIVFYYIFGEIWSHKHHI